MVYDATLTTVVMYLSMVYKRVVHTEAHYQTIILLDSSKSNKCIMQYTFQLLTQIIKHNSRMPYPMQCSHDPIQIAVQTNYNSAL